MASVDKLDWCDFIPGRTSVRGPGFGSHQPVPVAVKFSSHHPSREGVSPYPGDPIPLPTSGSADFNDAREAHSIREGLVGFPEGGRFVDSSRQPCGSDQRTQRGHSGKKLITE
jgi:hypothetical protein